MRIHRVVGYGTVMLAVVLLPLGVFAQCGMPGMSHGGHGSTHESAHDSPAAKPKLSKQVRAVLEHEERRAELMDAVAADDGFVREMIRRIAATPKGRALMRERLASGPADLDTGGEPTDASEAPERGHQH